MGLFTKKPKQEISELPDLPPLPRLPELPELEPEREKALPMLPSINTSRFPSAEFPPIRTPLTKEISSGEEEVTNSKFNQELVNESSPRTLELPEQTIPRPRLPVLKQIKQEQPVFVRIDKYQEAIRALSEIKAQLSQIESYLREVKSLKQKEETELSSWEQDLESIKSRLNNIDQSVFSKLG